MAAVASYADARAARGEWLLRIEDVDAPRSRPGAVDEILRQLERYGFVWDGAVVRQTERTADYEAALARLRAQGVVYACACARRDLESAPLGAGGERVYPGTCRAGIPADRRPRAARAWRVRVDANGDARIGFTDRLQGMQEQDLPGEVGDFVVKRADGLFAYQLAVVVDDAWQGVTDVVRGADLLASTARQIYLQRLLGFPTPRYLHVPVAIDASGDKLSKQTQASALPDDPLPALLATWRFLDQPLPTGTATPASVAEFWAWATQAWAPARLPPVAMLPAPRAFGARSGTGV